MRTDKYILFLFLIFSAVINAQDSRHTSSFGFHYGFGSATNKKDYTYNVDYFKLQYVTTISESGKMKYEIMVQSQLDFVEHQLLNLKYVSPTVPNYLEKRERFAKLKDIKNYKLNFGLLLSMPLSKHISVFALGSVGPMITDTETESLSKGFAFSSIFSVGFSVKFYSSVFEFRPNFSHLSNAGLQNVNNGINTFNFEFGLIVPL